MDDINLRVQALSEAIRISPNNEAGDAKQVVSDAEAFYAFLTGKVTPNITINSNVDPEQIAKYIRGMSEGRKGQDDV